MHRKRLKKRRSSSKAWDQFNEIFDGDIKVDQFFVCIECEDIIYNPSTDGNTNVFRRHVCMQKNDNNEKIILIKKSDVQTLKVAAAKFVCKDLRFDFWQLILLTLYNFGHI